MYPSNKRIDCSVPVLHLFVEIHESPALGKAGHPRLQRRPHRSQHSFVLRKLFPVKFRISSAQDQSVQVLRQGTVTKRTEGNEIASKIFQKVQIIFIVETERLISGNAKTDFFPDRDVISGLISYLL